MFKKNVSVTGFPLVLVAKADGSAVATGTTTAYVTKDGGIQAAVVGTVVHRGNGQWSVDLTAGEMNGDVVGLLFAHTSAIPVHFTIRTTSKLVSDLVDAAAPTASANATAVWAAAPAGTPLAEIATTVWNEATRTLTAGTNIVLAKGTNLTGLNDIAAAAIVTGGAITTGGGAVSNVTTTGTTTNLTNLPAVPTDWLAAAGVKADAVSKIQAGLSTYAGGAVASVTGAVGSVTGNVVGSVGSVAAGVIVTTNNDKTGYALTTAPPTSGTIAAAVWDEVRTGHTAAGTFGSYLDAAITGVSTGGTSAASIAAAVWQDLLSSADFSTAASIGKLVKDNLATPPPTAAAITTAVWAGAPAGTPLADIAAAVRDVNNATPTPDSLGAAVNAGVGGGGGTGATATEVWAHATATALAANAARIPASPAAVGSNMGSVTNVIGAVGSVTAPVTAGTVTDKSGYSLVAAPPTAGVIATAVWDAAPAGTPLADIADAVRDVNISSPAPNSLGAAIAAVKADTGAVKLKTDNLPASPAAVGSNMGAVTNVIGAVGSVTAPVTAGTVTDKSGYILGATGLDALSMTLTSSPRTFPEWFVWLTLRFRRTGKNKTTGAITVYGTDGATVITSQATSDTATEQTVGVTQ